MADDEELDVDEGNKMRQPLEGQLYKYTNVVKGWQYRWFVLNPDIGMLEYYMLDEVKKGKPRGAVHLAGAVISPSDEDGQMFTVSAACGEVYKLRVVSCGRSRFPGQDAKERQFWINRLRKVAEDHTKTIAQKNPPLLPREIRSPHEGVVPQDKGSGTGPGASSQTVWYTTGMGGHTEASATPAEAFSSVREILARAGKLYYNLAQSIESLPSHGPGFKYYDKDMLLLKATSCATVMCLEQCLSILQESKVALPSYVLEPRSLLEVYADFMSYPHMFLRVADGETPEERLVMVTEWLLCSLYATRKPFYGGKLHCVSGEVKSATGEMVCKVSGEWDTKLELQYTDGRSKEWNISELKRQPKRCRPIDSQDNFESRRLWQPVTQALRSGNTVLASHHKCQIEERLHEQSCGKGDPEQGEMAQQTHDAKLFRLEGNVWKYKYPLGKPS
ncbi:hypothetical protein HPB51_006288 [Rhipicephalus microplus]|uniref:PH domain-containing protein n=1 Tax=Rhipicephalus microplus TaxID=6941 RepID=A0A9J6EN03_RHIMP|nr:hypothetical protein HPB51_006288 [Rhipicephalus microplus]